MTQDIYILIEHFQGRLSEISSTLLSAGRQLAEIHKSKLIAILLGSNSQNLFKEIPADKIIYVDHPLLKEFNQDGYQQVLCEIINSKLPYMVLFGNTSIGSDLAGFLSVKLNMDVASSCSRFTDTGNIVSQICGGKIMVESNPAPTTTLITVVPGGYKQLTTMTENKPEIEIFPPSSIIDLRIKNLKIIEPESSDVDISKEPILVSIGRGIQTKDNIELADNLAKALGGVVCASRPVIDQGWLPTTRLVGKSGKHVQPKLYLAIGISGAPEHVEAITNSEVIIAINTDAKAPIFDIAKYGTQTDLFDLIEILVEKIETAKIK